MLDLLRLFIQVVEEKSYTHVARRLGVSQPAISNQMRVLEDKVGVKLFQRQGKSFTLTREGEAVLRYALKILDEWSALLLEIGEDQTELSGKVHIGASHIPGEYLLPKVLRKLQNLHPKLTFKITIGDSTEIAGKVQNQDVDFAVVGSNFNSEKLYSVFWLKDDIRCIVPGNHPLLRLERVSPKDLLEYALVVRESGSGHRRALEDALSQVGLHVEDFQIGLEAGSTETVKNAIRAGFGYSFLSQSALQDLDGLAVCPVAGLQIERGFYLLTRRTKSLSQIAQFCYEYLSAAPNGEK